MTRHRADRPDLIMETIADFTEEYGYGPTVRELRDRVGLSSTSAVHHHLRKLAAEGRITYDPRHARTLAVVVPDAPEPPDPVELTSLALHRWRHPSFKGWDRCKCRDDARVALSLVGVAS